MSAQETFGGRLTRRHFLRYSGATVGGLACSAALGPLAEAFPAFAPAAADLSPRRQATTKALVEAVATVDPIVDGSRAVQVADELARRYALEPSETRDDIDLMLDTVEHDLEPGAFKRLSPADRVAVLRASMSGQGNARHGVPRHESPNRSALVGGAIGLASMPFYGLETPWRLERFPA